MTDDHPHHNQMTDIVRLSESGHDMRHSNGSGAVLSTQSMSADNPTLFGLSSDIQHLLKRIDIPETDSIDPKDRLRVYGWLYEQVSQWDDVFDRFDLSRGEAAWLKGTILNLFKPITPGRRGILKRGEWGVFCERHRIEPDTAENERHIATRYTRLEARSLGYTRMVKEMKEQRRVKQQGETCTATSHDDTEVHGSGGHAASQPHGSDEMQGDGCCVLRIVDVPHKLKRVADALESICSGLPQAKDLFANPNRSTELLDAFGTPIDGIRSLVEHIDEHTIPHTYRVIQEYVAEGQHKSITQADQVREDNQ